MYEKLSQINEKPSVFGCYTAEALWADPYRAQRMLDFHLNDAIDVSSRNAAFIDASSAWIVDRFQLGPDKSVCDFGCGPGLYTSRLAGSGASVTGLDFSENSIRYARAQAVQSGQEITYLQTNYLEFDHKDRFDLITMIMCDFCALSPTQRKTLLRIFQDRLKDNGAVLLDVYSMTAFAEREEAAFYEKNQLDHFWHKDAYYAFVNTFKYDDDAVVLDKYSIFPENGGAETVYNWLQYFSLHILTEELAASGFAVNQVLGDVAGHPFSEQLSEFAVVATKRG